MVFLSYSLSGSLQNDFKPYEIFRTEGIGTELITSFKTCSGNVLMGKMVLCTMVLCTMYLLASIFRGGTSCKLIKERER